MFYPPSLRWSFHMRLKALRVTGFNLPVVRLSLAASREAATTTSASQRGPGSSQRSSTMASKNFLTSWEGGETDFKEPLIVRKGNTVADVCNKLHRNMKKDFRFGLVWGKSVKFGGQRVGLNHILIDEDVLTVVKKR